MPTKKKQSSEMIIVPEIPKQVSEHIVRGLMPLIVCEFGWKAKQQMYEDNVYKGSKVPNPSKTDVRDPRAEFEASKYRDIAGYDGFPAANVRAAMIGACRFIPGIAMTFARGVVSVLPDGTGSPKTSLCRLGYSEDPILRRDYVRPSTGGATLRYRASYEQWWMRVKVIHYPDNISMQSIIYLLNRAGQQQGLGEWRPERGGVYGTFEVLPGDPEKVYRQMLKEMPIRPSPDGRDRSVNLTLLDNEHRTTFQEIDLTSAKKTAQEAQEVKKSARAAKKAKG